MDAHSKDNQTGLRSHFDQIRSVLKEHSFLHELEALERYGSKLPGSYQKWICYLNTLSPINLIEIENNLKPSGPIPEEYRLFLENIKKLIELNRPNYSSQEIPKEIERKFSAKKKHELSLINEQLKKNETLKKHTSFVDIGSGAGHLSSLLVYQSEKRSLCIDASSEFQKIGIEKLKKYSPETLAKLTFKSIFIKSGSKLEIPKDSLVLGLHACGGLSNEIINISIKNSASLLNYGCCYHKTSPEDINISKQAQVDPLELTNHAKTMAAKSYKTITLKEDTIRRQVKLFRYALHIFTQDKMQSSFTALGNAKKSDYKEDFSDYAYKYSPKIKERYSKKELDLFFEAKETQSKIKNLLSLGVLRSHLARLVELYIVLDRALFLAENNKEVFLEEVFSRDLSPRNIALIAFEK